MKDCPSQDALLRLACGLEVQDREILLDHLALCAPCRSAAADLAEASAATGPAVSVPMPAPSRALRKWLPAAAAILLAFGVFLAPRKSPRLPAVTGPSPAAPVASPFAESPERSIVAGHAVALTLQAGALGAPVPGGFELRRGSACVEDPGEPFALIVPGGRVLLDRGVLLAVVEPSQPLAGLWLERAEAAGDAAVRVTVLEGSARVRTASGEVLLGPREETRISDGLAGKPQALPASFQPAWTGREGWTPLVGTPLHLKDGSLDLPPSQESWVWEAVLKRLSPSAGLSLRLGGRDGTWEMPVGAPLQGSPGLLRVRVETSRGWVRVTAGSYEMAHAPFARLGAGLSPCAEGPGLRAWGGEIEVLEARWRALP